MNKRRIALLLGCYMALASPMNGSVLALEAGDFAASAPSSSLEEPDGEALDIGGADALQELLGEEPYGAQDNTEALETLPDQEISFLGDDPQSPHTGTNGATLFEDLPSYEADPTATVGNVIFDAEVRVKEEAWLFIGGSYLLEKPENYGEVDPGLVSVVGEEESAFEATEEIAFESAEEPLFGADFEGEAAFEAGEDGLVAAAEPSLECGDRFVAEEEPLFGALLEDFPAEEEAFSQQAYDLQENSDAQVGIDSSRFFTLSDGLVRVITTTLSGKIHTGVYAFDENGALVVGGEVTINGETYYMLSESSAKMDSGVSDISKTPYNSTYGQVATNCWRWDKESTSYRRYGSDGKLIPIATLLEQYKDQEGFMGYFTIGGLNFCLNDEGVPQTGTKELTNGKGETYTYYFLKDIDESTGVFGVMFHDGWLQDETSKGIRWRYFSPETETLGRLWVHGVVAALLENDTYYLLSKGGYYIINSCKQGENGAYYHSKEDGSLYTSEIAMYNDVNYYYGEDGARVSWVNSYHKVKSDNLYYYFGTTPGAIQQSYGWKYITDGDTGTEVGWFFFAEDGKTKVNSWVDNNTRYLDAEGKLCSGLKKVGGDYYYFMPSTPTELKGTIVTDQMLKSGDVYYYAGKDGKLVKKGWITYKGHYYYLSSYKCLTNQRKKYEGVWGWLCETGKYLPQGWNVVSNPKNLARYVTKKGKLLTSTSAKISGLTYYFDSNGYRKNDVSDVVLSDFYLVCDRVNGVITVYNSARTIAVKTIRCSVGKKSYETPTGKFKLKISKGGRWVQLNNGYYAQYGTGFGSGYAIHSVPLPTQTVAGVPASVYNALGNPVTSGNIYVCVADAKWIYEHCDGAYIKIKDKKLKADEALKGPLGRSALVPMTNTCDPTDPLATS